MLCTDLYESVHTAPVNLSLMSLATFRSRSWSVWISVSVKAPSVLGSVNESLV